MFEAVKFHLLDEGIASQVCPRSVERVLRLLRRRDYLARADAIQIGTLKVATIRGTDDCLARGYDRTGFFEVDTGDQPSWTVQLTDTADRIDYDTVAGAARVTEATVRRLART